MPSRNTPRGGQGVRAGYSSQARNRFNQRPKKSGGGYSNSNIGNRRQNQGSRKPKKDYINPARFIQQATYQEEEVYTPIHKFADFPIENLLKNNLHKMGYENPSPIQDQSIPESLQGKDLVGIANTGTGKTAAFAIPILQKMLTQPNSKAIILAPTRELAEQIEQQFRKIGRNSGIFGALLIGGVAINPQLRDLRYNPRVIIGTPGRVKDHLERKSLNLQGFDTVVLDEVDRMLDMGFVHDITKILSLTNENRQNLYFSATMDARVKKIIEGFSNDPVQISVKSGNTSANVNQNIIKYQPINKIDKLQDVLNLSTTGKTIIFDDTQRMVEKLSKELTARGYAATSIHGGKSQSQRQRALKQFKNNDVSVLVATDVAARGIDVSDITHVINYSLPQTYDDYVHRIGRTGRAGKTGQALTFIEG